MLVGRWMHPIELEDLRHGYQLLLEAAEADKCQRWLLDVRRRQNTHQVSAQWIVNTLLPQLAPRLGGRTKLAYLMAPVYMRDEAADAAFPPAAHFVGKPFVGEWFIEENTAIAWLHAQSVLAAHHLIFC